MNAETLTPTTEERADARRRALQVIADFHALQAEYGEEGLRQADLPAFDERPMRAWLTGLQGRIRIKFAGMRDRDGGDGFHPLAPKPGDLRFRGPYWQPPDDDEIADEIAQEVEFD